MFGALFKAVLNVAVTPIEVVKDVVTFGGSLEGEDELYTVKRLKKAAEKLNDALD